MSETFPPPLESAATPKTSTLAIWSLVLGILGVLFLLACLGPLFAIPAVICGHMAYSRIKRSGGALIGDGLALAGLITGYVSIGLSMLLVPMMMAIAIPNFVKARNTSMQNACINNLRQIDAAKHEWALENGKKDDAVPTESDLTPYFKNHQMPHCIAGGIYIIGAITNPPTCSIPGHKLRDTE